MWGGENWGIKCFISATRWTLVLRATQPIQTLVYITRWDDEISTHREKKRSSTPTQVREHAARRGARTQVQSKARWQMYTHGRAAFQYFPHVPRWRLAVAVSGRAMRERRRVELATAEARRRH